MGFKNKKLPDTLCEQCQCVTKSVVKYFSGCIMATSQISHKYIPPISTQHNGCKIHIYFSINTKWKGAQQLINTIKFFGEDWVDLMVEYKDASGIM